MDRVSGDHPPAFRRDEWSAAALRAAGGHETIGLHREELSVDGPIHTVPCGGEGTGGALLTGASSVGSGPSPPMRRVSGSADSATGPTTTVVLLPATLAEVECHALLEAVGTLHLDRGCDNPVVHHQVAALGVALDVAPRRPTRSAKRSKVPSPPGDAGRSSPSTRGSPTTGSSLQHRTPQRAPAGSTRPRVRHLADRQADRQTVPSCRLMPAYPLGLFVPGRSVTGPWFERIYRGGMPSAIPSRGSSALRRRRRRRCPGDRAPSAWRWVRDTTIRLDMSNSRTSTTRRRDAS